MIKSFKNKALADLFQTGTTAKIDAKMHKPITVRLDRLEVSERPEDMNLPGYNFHPLQGFNPTRFTVHVNGHGALPLSSREKTPPALTSSSITSFRTLRAGLP